MTVAYPQTTGQGVPRAEAVDASPASPAPQLTPYEERIASAVAAAAMPPGRFLEGGGAATVAKLRRWLIGTTPGQVKGIRALLWSAEALALARTGRPFSMLPSRKRNS